MIQVSNIDLDVYNPLAHRRQPRQSFEIGFFVDSATGCIVVTHLATSQRLVCQRRFFVRITGAHPRSIAGRFSVTSDIMRELGFVIERGERDDNRIVTESVRPA